MLGNWFTAMTRLADQGFKVQPLMLSNGRVYLQIDIDPAAQPESGAASEFGPRRRLLWLPVASALMLCAILTTLQAVQNSQQIASGRRGLPHHSVLPSAASPPVASPSLTTEISCSPSVGQLLTDFLDGHPAIRVSSDITLGQLRAVQLAGECAQTRLSVQMYLTSTAKGWQIEKVSQPFDRVTSTSAN